jgi:hypothetical protein
MPAEHDELEGFLASLPLRGLGPMRDAELIQAIRAAGRARASWWARRIAVWQAAAACLLVGLAVGAAMRARTSPPPRSPAEPTVLPAPPAVMVRVDAPILARADIDPSPDLSRWEALVQPIQGGQR